MTLLVLAVGHPDRGDDAIAHAVVDELARRDPELRTRHVFGDLTALSTHWTDDDDVVVVDACRSGAPIGTVAIADAEAIRTGATPTSGHGLGVAEGIELARRLDRLPRRLRVVGIEGRRFSLGTASPELVKHISGLADQVIESL